MFFAPQYDEDYAAQASITVEGTEFVIDSARAKELPEKRVLVYNLYLQAGPEKRSQGSEHPS